MAATWGWTAVLTAAWVSSIHDGGCADGEMRHREVMKLAQGHTPKNCNATWEQRLSWTAGGSGAGDDGTAALGLVGTSAGMWPRQLDSSCSELELNHLVVDEVSGIVYLGA